jgi:hypothetical protein
MLKVSTGKRRLSEENRCNVQQFCGLEVPTWNNRFLSGEIPQCDSPLTESRDLKLAAFAAVVRVERLGPRRMCVRRSRIEELGFRSLRQLDGGSVGPAASPASSATSRQ